MLFRSLLRVLNVPAGITRRFPGNAIESFARRATAKGATALFFKPSRGEGAQPCSMNFFNGSGVGMSCGRNGSLRPVPLSKVATGPRYSIVIEFQPVFRPPILKGLCRNARTRPDGTRTPLPGFGPFTPEEITR